MILIIKDDSEKERLDLEKQLEERKQDLKPATTSRCDPYYRIFFS